MLDGDARPVGASVLADTPETGAIADLLHAFGKVLLTLRVRKSPHAEREEYFP
jgi:hypothetical protein